MTRAASHRPAEVLRNLRDGGLSPPLLAVGDGALGLWAALGQVFPVTEHQRCWNHRVLNVQSKLPKRLQAEARGRLREMAESETQALCEERRDGYVAELRSLGQRAAAETVLRDWEDFVAFSVLVLPAMFLGLGSLVWWHQWKRDYKDHLHILASRAEAESQRTER